MRVLPLTYVQNNLTNTLTSTAMTPSQFATNSPLDLCSHHLLSLYQTFASLECVVHTLPEWFFQNKSRMRILFCKEDFKGLCQAEWTPSDLLSSHLPLCTLYSSHMGLYAVPWSDKHMVPQGLYMCCSLCLASLSSTLFMGSFLLNLLYFSP